MKFETERLILRKPELKDAEDIFSNYAHDPEVTRYITWKPHTDLNATKEWLKEHIESLGEERKISFSIWHKETEQVIGMAGGSINGSTATFGYTLTKSFWNQGIMTEACRPVFDYLLKRNDIWRIEAVHDIDNPASGRVMEKLGMTYEGTLRRYVLHPNLSDIPRDCKMYALVKE